tara:strand:+ start:26041 stop:26163 length:123 start_codon:yes stop_codon:yes gene_type:complete
VTESLPEAEAEPEAEGVLGVFGMGAAFNRAVVGHRQARNF